MWGKIQVKMIYRRDRVYFWVFGQGDDVMQEKDMDPKRNKTDLWIGKGDKIVSFHSQVGYRKQTYGNLTALDRAVDRLVAEGYRIQ